jgi:small conductance mechanosensitive channel
MILGKLGVPIGPIIASAGIIGAAIAFGTQSLIKDFVSGLFIIAENQYHVDDYVDIGSISGKVEAISVRTTTVRGEDGSLYFVPNGSITITSNKSVGPLRETLKIELATDSSLTAFTKKLSEISEELTSDEATGNLFVEGPTVGSVVAVTKKAICINIHYKTDAVKRKKAASAVLRRLAAASKKDQIHLV